MSHMVIYRGADGKPGYQQAEDIHDAVTFVEQMRNGEGVEQARIFRLEEVVFEYRPYYRVELSSSGAQVITTNQPEAIGVAPVPAPVNGSNPVATGPVAVSAVEMPEEASLNLDDPFEVVEGNGNGNGNGIAHDELDGEPATNGARRGLFGR